MRLYGDLSWLWSEVTPAGTYTNEAQDLCEIVSAALGRSPKNILELGAGGGYLLHDVQAICPDIEVTLVDSSEKMLVEAGLRNPNAKIIHADMTTLDLREQFDVILLHDAVMYLEDTSMVAKVLDIMRAHISRDGVAVVVPDVCKETFEERILTAEAEGERARVHFTEWHWDSDPKSDRVAVEFSVLIREHDHDIVQSHHETHHMLVLSLGDWMEIFQRNRWMQDFPSTPWVHGGEFFLLRPSHIK